MRFALGQVWQDESGNYIVAHDCRSDVIEWHFYKSQSDIITDDYIFKEFWKVPQLLDYRKIKGVKND